MCSVNLILQTVAFHGYRALTPILQAVVISGIPISGTRTRTQIIGTLTRTPIGKAGAKEETVADLAVKTAVGSECRVMMVDEGTGLVLPTAAVAVVVRPEGEEEEVRTAAVLVVLVLAMVVLAVAPILSEPVPAAAPVVAIPTLVA